MNTTNLRAETGIDDRSAEMGWFWFNIDDDRWLWSAQVERMHGYQPGTTAPSTPLLLSHVHLDDYRQVAATLHDARRTRRPFSSQHRIVDTAHHVHDVVMVAAPCHDTDGTILGMHGLCLDAPAGSADDRRQRVRAATRC
ncbi:PAS domain-containing protein [Mycobacterium branderi]|uniref:PAS fold-3 domain-containing protein n=1 Tax=Mycobacterium branderi TaxID=43348 RepID=A0A7I7W773_9MYCO|nr:PAS domain-containing protein [Mycobacterium branderi]MCV7231038.1 PAS domain-containing protein [Mycobacterium branderi]ORA38966.1 hypothetical protein BST20_10540 [Mycobacterium branderi]BBZ12333.1 hypothetical protein MBRA_25280 [Mycobacterium branderi]